LPDALETLFLQVHYADISAIPDKGDNTSVALEYKTSGSPPPRRAGIFLLATDGTLPPQVNK